MFGLPQGLKPQILNRFTAGLKACSTLCSSGLPGLKPVYLDMAFAALKGRSSTLRGKSLSRSCQHGGVC